MISKRLPALTLCVAGSMSACPFALAQEAQTAAQENPQQLVAPKLVEYVEAKYPSKAFNQGLEAVVVAAIDVDETGMVTGVKVVEPVGHGFDEAAQAAMRSFVFAPALQGEKPIPSQVIYRYTFFIKQQIPEKESEPEPPETAYEPEAESARYETVVRGRKPPREVTRREITRREITRIPGTGGDALRSIQNLPGMARAPAVSGSLIVRGSSPSDTKVFFESVPLPLLYHFGGLTSVINSDLLERIDFFPGNYSVRYGGAVGGVVEVFARAPARDRLHAYVDADFWDVGALAETPLGENWSIAAAARRSYIDAILNAALPEDGGFEFTTAPRYWDYQLIADYHPNAGDNLRLFLYGSDDKMVFVFGDDLGDNPNFGGGVDLRLMFHKLHARWEHDFSDRLSNQAVAAFGFEAGEGYLGENIRFKLDELPLYVRDELVFDPKNGLVLRTGIDGVFGWSKWRFRAPEMFPKEGGQWDPIGANTRYIEDEGQGVYLRPGWYCELELNAVKDLRLIPGLRIDYQSRTQSVDLDPRLVTRYQALEKTILKGGIGVFHQSPEGAEANEEYGNPDLDQIMALHYSLGVEQQLSENVEVQAEGFYKKLDNLVVYSDRMIQRDGKTVGEIYSNAGEGEVYGLEFLLKHQPTERFFGWIAYTLMQSRRIDHIGADPRLFDHDQTHILTVVASADIGWGWEAGVRFRLATGDPQTPAVGAAFDADSDLYWPIYGKVNSVRLPTFHQLDIRFDKNIVIENTIKMAIYVDVQNVYNQKNVETYQYNYDFTERRNFYGLPILPSLGVKLEY